MKFVIGVICSKKDKNIVTYYLKKYGYANLKIFNKFPSLIK